MFWSVHIFQIKLQFWIKHESKLVVQNKWDNSRLNSCISIGELVKPPHKKIFSKFIFVATFDTCWNHIYLFFFLRIICKMYVIIDDSIYFDHFCYTN